VIEQLLVTYDWGKAFAALQLVVKPAFDMLFVAQLGQIASARGDEVLAKILLSLDEDCTWHRAWTKALVAHAIADEPANAGVLRSWIERWRAPVLDAVECFAGEVFGPVSVPLPSIATRVDETWQATWSGIA